MDWSKILGLNEDQIPYEEGIGTDQSENLAPAPVKMIDPMVLASLQKKYPDQLPPQPQQVASQAAPQKTGILDKFSDENYQKAKAEANDRKSGLGWLQFAAGLGDAIAGRDQTNTNRNFQQIRDNINQETIGDFEKRKAQAVQDIATKKQLEGSDPNSAKSKIVQTTIKRLWGNKFSDADIAKVTADDADLIYKPMELKSKLDQTQATQEMAHEDRLAKIDAMKSNIKEKSDQKKSESIDKLVKEMRNDFDPDKGRAGNFGQISAKVQAADRLKTLIDSYKDGNLPPAQMEELSLGLANMLAGASGASRAQVEALVPHTFFGKSQDAAQWLLNEPRGAGQQKFVEQMAHTIDRERDTALNQLNSIRASRLPVHESLKRLDPDRYNAMLQSYGLDPNNIKDGKYVAPTPGSHGGERVILKTQTNQRTGQKRVVYSDGSTEIIDAVAGGR